MPKDFTLAEGAGARIVPCLDHQVVVEGQTVAIPDDYVDGLRGNDDWQPSGWSWPPEPDPAEAAKEQEAANQAAADDAADKAAADAAAAAADTTDSTAAQS